MPIFLHLLSKVASQQLSMGRVNDAFKTIKNASQVFERLYIGGFTHQYIIQDICLRIAARLLRQGSVVAAFNISHDLTYSMNRFLRRDKDAWRARLQKHYYKIASASIGRLGPQSSEQHWYSACACLRKLMSKTHDLSYGLIGLHLQLAKKQRQREDFAEVSKTLGMLVGKKWRAPMRFSWPKVRAELLRAADGLIARGAVAAAVEISATGFPVRGCGL